jgi:hypothetical protein
VYTLHSMACVATLGSRSDRTTRDSMLQSGSERPMPAGEGVL